MKRRVMIIGATQSGKSTLANALNEEKRALKKTQDVIYGKETIDTPGSYLENVQMYRYLIATAQSASKVVLLVSAAKPQQGYPPGFAKVFRCPVIGVISKCDLAPENVAAAFRQLKSSGVEEACFALDLTAERELLPLKEILFRKE